MIYMLDTNTCIYIIKKKPPRALETLRKLDIGEVCISAITLAELEYGVNKSQHREKNQIALTAFLSPIEILSFSDRAAVISGGMRASLEKKGQIIGAYDLLIAAHALSENLILVTNNTREFSRIPGLSLEKWAD